MLSVTTKEMNKLGIETDIATATSLIDMVSNKICHNDVTK